MIIIQQRHVLTRLPLIAVHKVVTDVHLPQPKYRWRQNGLFMDNNYTLFFIDLDVINILVFEGA